MCSLCVWKPPNEKNQKTLTNKTPPTPVPEVSTGACSDLGSPDDMEIKGHKVSSTGKVSFDVDFNDEQGVSSGLDPRALFQDDSEMVGDYVERNPQLADQLLKQLMKKPMSKSYKAAFMDEEHQEELQFMEEVKRKHMEDDAAAMALVGLGSHFFMTMLTLRNYQSLQMEPRKTQKNRCPWIMRCLGWKNW